MSHTWSPEVAMTKEEIDRFLDEKLVARIATHRIDGTIHITPVYYFWDLEYVWFELGKGLRPRQHITNLKRNPAMSIIIDKDIRPQVGSPEPGAQGVLIRGRAEFFEDEETQIRVARRLMLRYFGDGGLRYLDAALGDGKPGKNRFDIRVKPDKIIAWDFAKRPLREYGED